MGYSVNNRIYYLKALDKNAYQDNKSILMSSFESSQCDYAHSNHYDDNNEIDYVVEEYGCYLRGNNEIPGINISADNQGNVDVFNSSGGSDWSCTIYTEWSTCTYPY
jgi:hypothetical protein